MVVVDSITHLSATGPPPPRAMGLGPQFMRGQRFAANVVVEVGQKSGPLVVVVVMAVVIV